MLGAGIVGPLPRSRAIPSALGRDHKILGVRCQCFGDQFFADVRTIGISRVYEVDAQLNGTAKNREHRSGVLGWPPDSVAGNTHGSETKTPHGQFTAQRDSTAGTCERTRYFFFHIRSPKYPSYWM